ncbi:TylF/MycF family methyltransferase [bacterium]|nr:TylF/MycF family methyltransferase [bacterium]
MNKKSVQLEGGFRSKADHHEMEQLVKCFESNPDGCSQKINNFPLYARRAALTRFLVLYELFKKVLNIKGSIIECGVFRGFGLMTWSKLSAILEPTNLTRRIYGFDSFEGFPSVSDEDKSQVEAEVASGGLYANSHEELIELIGINDSTRYLGHIGKTSLIKGDACETIPNFIEENNQILVSLLFLDFDLFEPTHLALEEFVPRMPKGSILAFDELDNPLWPGETMAMLKYYKGSNPKIQRLEFDPYVGYIEV